MTNMTIKLPNRYSQKVELIPVSDDRWRLDVAEPYVRLGSDSSTGMISFFDPSGGPFVSVGEIINGMEVVAIQSTNTGIYVWMIREGDEDFEERAKSIRAAVKTAVASEKKDKPRIVLGMLGKAGSGKDTVGEYICEKYKFQRLALADPLKRGIQEMFVIPDELSNDRSRRDEPLPDMPEWTMRKLWQFVGTELVRHHIDDLAWIKSLIKRYPETGDIIVTDVRFPNEMEGIRKRSGCPVFFIKVVRPGHIGTDVGIKNHASEIHDLDGDFTIVNDGTLEELYDKVEGVLEEIGELLYE